MDKLSAMHQPAFRRGRLLWLILLVCIFITVLALLLCQIQLRDIIPIHRLQTKQTGSGITTALSAGTPGCQGYRELVRLKFLEDDALRWSLCQAGDAAESFLAYSLHKGRFPLCRLAGNLSQSVMKEISTTAVPLQLHNEATKRMVAIYGYPSDSISQYIAVGHAWEPILVGRLIRIALGLAAAAKPSGLGLTFLDVGSNIGVYSLSARDAGLTTVAVDANLRNLVRMRLAAQAMRWPATDPQLELVWAYFSDRVGIRYLSFPKAICNVGGAGSSESSDKDGGVWVTDTVPVMTATGNDLLPLLTTDLVVAKIDIETSENIFLSTGKRLFSEHRLAVVQMEWWRPKLSMPASRSPNYRQLIDYFLQRNYTLLSANTLRQLDPWNFYDWDTLWVRNEFLHTVQSLLRT